MWQYNYNVEQELYHHGIKGQKWGVRRFQNPDGSLTSAGKRHYDQWTKPPKGASDYQLKVMKAKKKYEESIGINKQIAKKELKDARKEMNEAAKNYVRFEKDMHKKVGSTKKLVTNSDGTYTKNGKTYQKWEVEAAQDYTAYKKAQRLTGQNYVTNIIATSLGSMAVTAVNTGSTTSGKEFVANVLISGAGGAAGGALGTAVNRSIYKKRLRQLTGT